MGSLNLQQMEYKDKTSGGPELIGRIEGVEVLVCSNGAKDKNQPLPT